LHHFSTLTIKTFHTALLPFALEGELFPAVFAQNGGFGKAVMPVAAP
jgi:hypothetical protein